MFSAGKAAKWRGDGRCIKDVRRQPSPPSLSTSLLSPARVLQMITGKDCAVTVLIAYKPVQPHSPEILPLQK